MLKLSVFMSPTGAHVGGWRHADALVDAGSNPDHWPKLAALLELERVARLTLQEARHLIVATDGMILLLDDETGALTRLAAFGDEMPGIDGLQRGTGIVGTVAATGIGEIVNDVEQDPRRVIAGTIIRALIVAPLKVGERVSLSLRPEKISLSHHRPDPRQR